MRTLTKYVYFTDENVRNFRASGERIEYYYDTGCRGLAVAVQGDGKEAKYVVFVNRYKNKKCLGPTRKTIASVREIPLTIAREMVKNIYENLDEFLGMDIRRGVCLYHDYQENGPLPRKIGELPMQKPRKDTDIELKYKKLLHENEELKWVVNTVVERLQRLSDSIKTLMDTFC